MAFSAKFTAPLGNAGFGYAVFRSDAFVGSSFLCVEADNLLFKFWCVTLWNNKYLFSFFIILYLISHPCYNYIIAPQSEFGALLTKEFRRFTSSPNYMLNCGLGTVLMPILAIVVLVKGRSLFQNFLQFLEEEQMGGFSLLSLSQRYVCWLR